MSGHTNVLAGKLIEKFQQAGQATTNERMVLVEKEVMDRLVKMVEEMRETMVTKDEMERMMGAMMENIKESMQAMTDEMIIAMEAMVEEFKENIFNQLRSAGLDVEESMRNYPIEEPQKLHWVG